jgi:cytochrome c5
MKWKILWVLAAVFVAHAAGQVEQRKLLDQYCVVCHNQKLKTANLTLDKMDVEHVGDGAEVWEKVVRKIHGGTMPPAGMPRPDKDTLQGLRSTGRRRAT